MTDPGAITVTAELVEDDAPVEIAATPVIDRPEDLPQPGEDLLHREVEVTWLGDVAVHLRDARFTHRVDAHNGDGELLLAGRGCAWQEFDDDIEAICTDDLVIVPVDPGDTHAYPVDITPGLGPVSLRPGTYVTEEAVTWTEQDADPGTQQTFTARLTYQWTADARHGRRIAPHVTAAGYLDRMTLNQFRSLLYKLARGLGDVNAVKRGTVGKWIARRTAGRGTGRMLGRLFK